MSNNLRSSTVFRIFLSCISFCIFFSIALSLYKNYLYQKEVLGASFVSKLNKDNFKISEVDSFKYFYEPIGNTSVTDFPDWLHSNPNEHINSDTLNDRYEYSTNKNDQIYRIITMGDSFTFGQYVDTKFNYSERLEDMLNSLVCKNNIKFEVINLGVPGYDIGYTIQRYALRGVKYKPDLILWYVNQHNFQQLRDKISIIESEILQSVSKKEIEQHRNDGDYYFAANEATRRLTAQLGYENILHQQIDYLNKFKKLYSGPLVIIANPAIVDQRVMDIMHTFVQRRENTWDYWNMPDLRNIEGILPDGHPNERGHMIIATQIFSYFQTLPIYPCKAILN